MTEQADTEFKPLGGGETTEDAEFAEHDMGTEASGGLEASDSGQDVAGTSPETGAHSNQGA